MSFHSLENKELLWDILQEDGYFNNIRPSLMQNIKTEFENTMVEMDHDNNNESLINKNKQFISNFTYKLKVLILKQRLIQDFQQIYKLSLWYCYVKQTKSLLFRKIFLKIDSCMLQN